MSIGIDESVDDDVEKAMRGFKLRHSAADCLQSTQSRFASRQRQQRTLHILAGVTMSVRRSRKRKREESGEAGQGTIKSVAMCLRSTMTMGNIMVGMGIYL